MRRFILSCESTVDMPYAYVSGRDIPIFDIGTIIASHCGPGTVAVFFFGDERQPNEK